MKLLLLCIAALSICESCQYDPYASLYTTAKPRSQDLVGRYKLIRQTVTGDGLSALRGGLSMVQLLADGRFNAINVPPRRAQSPDAGFFAKLLNGSGNWHIGSVGGIGNGLGREQTHWGVYLESPITDIEPVGLTGAKPPYGLIFTMGDPDQGRVMIFERQD